MCNVSKIVKFELCNGCGTCFSVCPSNAISISIDGRKGILFSKIDTEKCTNCGLCLKVCPSLDLIPRTKGLLGNFVSLYYGFSLDDKLRYKASSGGIVSSLLKYLLENNIIDGVIMAKPTFRSPFLYEPFITSNISDIYEFAGTRYFPIPMNKILKKLLSMKGHFVFIGTPCQINGIHRFENLYKEIREKIYLKIGFFCGGAPNLNSYRYYTYVHDIDTEGLISIYRGIGWPGHNVFIYKNGKKILISRRPKNLKEKAYYTLSFFPIFAQKRCLLCVDRFASYADMSVGDAWLNKFKNDKKGTSLIIVRSEKVNEILQDMKRKEYIYYDEISVNDVINSQKIFSHFYDNFYTTHSLLMRKMKISLNVDMKKSINYHWFVLMLLIKLGMKISMYDRLWNLLLLYGMAFNFIRDRIIKV